MDCQQGTVASRLGEPVNYLKRINLRSLAADASVDAPAPAIAIAGGAVEVMPGIGETAWHDG